jgi:hypothetical protein
MSILWIYLPHILLQTTVIFSLFVFFFNLLDLSNLWQKSCIIKNGFLLVFV